MKEQNTFEGEELDLDFDISPEPRLNICGSMPKSIALCRFNQMPDVTIQITKWPSGWFRFWTWVFFGAKWERID